MTPDDQIRELQAAVAHQRAGRLAEAINIYKRVLKAAPDNFGCVYPLAMLHAQQGNFEAATTMLRRAAKIRPQNADVHYNLAVALSMTGNHDEAAQFYKRVIDINPGHANARNNYAATLLQKGQLVEALQQYDQLITAFPDLADAYNNRGMVLQNLKRFEDAIRDHDKAIALRPNFPEAHVNRGNALAGLHRPDDAVASYQKAIALRPDFADAYNNTGNINFDRGFYSEAVVAYDRALALRADDLEAQSRRLSAKMHLCDWSNLQSELGRFLAAIENQNSTRAAAVTLKADDDVATTGKSPSPSAVARLTDDPAIIFASAVDWLRQHAGNPSLFPHVRRPAGKLRLGYLSQDFRQHVTGLSYVEMFEKHDKSRFELFGFSLAPDDGSAVGKRIAAAFDQFDDLSALSDMAAGRHIHDLEIDVLVEMVPHSLGSRPAILAHRPAPIQVNGWPMGYSAGATFFDYILADKWQLPFALQPFFLEKIVHLPHTCFGHDSTQAISDRTPTRSEAGLPEQGFVFCCFNASYKIFPQFFTVWMRLLGEVADSVLWLARHKEPAIANLRREASNLGIDPARLIFAERQPAMENHLARHRLADLFLDTLPYNAQVTAMDALWAGLPVLTCAGRSYAGRIAASQLQGIGLQELIADDLATYERLALALAGDRERLGHLRAKVEANRLTTPLFDTGRLCRELEAAYQTMVDIRQHGQSPRSFSVDPL